MLSDDSRIFKNEDVLSTDYLPDILPHREGQVQQLADSLESISRGKKRNIFICGAPGIGKTASANFVFREFENHSGIKTIYINCWNYNTSIAVLTKIALEFGAFVQRRGWARDEIMSRLIEALQKSRKSLVVCLDEVDQLVRKDQGVLYDLLGLGEYVKSPVGLIFISNDPHVFAGLEPRIMSRMSLDEIEFKPYTIQEMRDIMQERVEHAFRFAEEGVTALTASHAISKNGDVRVGLQCLLKAGRIAEQERSDKLRISHLKSVLKEVREIKPKILKTNVTDIEKLIIDIVNKDGKTTFDELYGAYSKCVETPLTKRMFREYVNHLDELSLIKIGKRKLGRSRFISKV